MAQTYATEVAGIVSTPVVKPTSPGYGARLRRYRASITLASQADGDTVVLARIPAGSVFAFGLINTDTSLGSSTVAVGISGTAALYKAAATFTATNTPTLFGKTERAGFSATETLTADTLILLTNTTAALPSSGLLVIDLYFSNW